MKKEQKTLVKVVAGLFAEGEKFLICKRPEGKARANLWEFAGGKTEEGETEKETLIRECGEELSAEIFAGEVFYKTEYEYEDIKILLVVLKAKFITRPKKTEHSEIKWIKIKDIDKYPFCPADYAVLDYIKTAGLK